MSGNGKIAVVVILLAAVAAAVIWFTVSSDRGTRPAAMGEQVLEKVDVVTGEVVSATREEWEKLGRKGDRWKNPKTGDYTVVNGMTCEACGALVPGPDISLKDKREHEPKWYEQQLDDYVCPKCGKRVRQHKPPVRQP